MTASASSGHLSLLGQHPRRILGLVAGACVAMLVFGLYLQHVVGLEPCPMCIVQRYALVAVALIAGISALLHRPAARHARRCDYGVVPSSVAAAACTAVAAWLIA